MLTAQMYTLVNMYSIFFYSCYVNALYYTLADDPVQVYLLNSKAFPKIRRRWDTE